MIETTAVYLTEEQAKLFIEFQKRFAFLKLLESIQGFDIKNGSITISFDSVGKISSVEKKEHYRLP